VICASSVRSGRIAGNNSSPPASIHIAREPQFRALLENENGVVGGWEFVNFLSEIRVGSCIWLSFRAIAVGTPVAERPPHRSTRAAFPHVAPTSGV
jgi:hypothetical protein